MATVQGNLSQARKMQNSHKFQSQQIPKTKKQILYLQQLWMQEKYTQTKQAISCHTQKGSKVFIHLILIWHQWKYSEPLKSRTRKYTLHKYTKCHYYLKEREFKPEIHWLDNESPNALNKYNRNKEVDVQ